MIILASFGLGGGEIILILAMVLILFGAKKLPELAKGLGQGLDEFWHAGKGFRNEIDGASSEAGRSVGGIYGNAAAQALTPDNHVAELYDPEVLRRPPKSRKKLFQRLLRWLTVQLRRLFRKSPACPLFRRGPRA